MPKVLVLFDGRSDDTARAARAIGEGAESVRFTEVELRALETGERASAYDGVVLVGSRESAQVATESLTGPLADRVGGVFTADGGDEVQPALVAAMLSAGMIVVGPRPDGDARALGARVAKVTEWVRHARSHEHGHSHGHSHDHSHSH